ncbi:MAG: RNA polymerase sigma factor [Candidatus Competibacteraceae bacterium]
MGRANAHNRGPKALDARQQRLDRFLAGVEHRALRMAELMVRNRDDALDVVQDAMLTLACRYADRDEGEWRALFFRVLNSRIHDWLRRAWVRDRWRRWFSPPAEPDEDPLEAQPDGRMPPPDQRLILDQAGLAVEESLRELPPRQRQAFLLRAWEGLDVAETARAMGCGEGSVKVHYSRAVRALRARLGEHWP